MVIASPFSGRSDFCAEMLWNADYSSGIASEDVAYKRVTDACMESA